MFEVGRLCLKLRGRDSNNYAVVVEKIDKTYVLIDGNVRRRKCNIIHLEPLDTVFKIKKGEASSEIKKLLKKEGLLKEERVIKKKKTKPKKTESKKNKPVKTKKTVKKKTK